MLPLFGNIAAKKGRWMGLRMVPELRIGRWLESDEGFLKQAIVHPSHFWARHQLQHKDC